MSHSAITYPNPIHMSYGFDAAQMLDFSNPNDGGYGQRAAWLDAANAVFVNAYIGADHFHYGHFYRTPDGAELFVPVASAGSGPVVYVLAQECAA